MAGKASRVAAQQIFRQFAWNLAGTLGGSKTGGVKPAARPGKR